MPTLITDNIFSAYLQCKTKAQLIAVQTAEPPHEISDWRKRLAADYKAQCLGRLSALCDVDTRYYGTPPLSALKSQRYHFITNCTIGNDIIKSSVDALQRTTIADKSAPGF